MKAIVQKPVKSQSLEWILSYTSTVHLDSNEDPFSGDLKWDQNEITDTFCLQNDDNVQVTA